MKWIIIILLSMSFAFSQNIIELRKQTEQGDVVAQSNLGIFYEHGEGVPQDYTEALKWYKLAAEQGDSKAQFNLGVFYIKGKGVSQNYTKAKEWYEKACNNGVQIGCDTYKRLSL